jgi:spoIIIJ-associated protein
MSEPRFVEATGPDVDTAIKNGLARLNASSKDVIVEVLEESSRGLFGIGGKPARVRLTLLAPVAPPPAPAAPAERGKPPAPRRDSQAAREPKESRERREPRGPRPERGEHPDRGGQADRGGQSDRGRSDRGGQSERGRAADRSLSDATLDEAPELPTRPPAADDDEARVAVETLQELLSKMGIEAQVEPYYVDAADDNEIGPLVLQISGRDLGALIGRRGDTLAALQYITRLIVSRDIQRRANLVVDVERYKSRRERRLRSLALRMAKQATQRGRTVTLEPMAAYERRIIHLTLRDRTDVYTQSIGEGDNRKVTIVPVRDR